MLAYQEASCRKVTGALQKGFVRRYAVRTFLTDRPKQAAQPELSSAGTPQPFVVPAVSYSASTCLAVSVTNL